MESNKNIGSIIFYLFIIVFVSIAYLYNNGYLKNLIKTTIEKTTDNTIPLGYDQQEYKVNYTEKFNNYTIEVSGFEEEENWQGEYEVNDENFWEGKSSYIITSINNKPTSLTLDKTINFSDYSIFKILIYSGDEDNINNIKKLTLRFGNTKDRVYYEYDIRKLTSGWNVIQIPKKSFTSSANRPGLNTDFWDKIDRVSLELTSLPKSTVELSVDRLWTERNDNYRNDFETANPNTLSIKSFNQKSYVNFWPLGTTYGLIGEITSVTDFTYTAKIIPQKPGSFGIVGRIHFDNGHGYFLDLAGIDMNAWQLYKVGKETEGYSTIQLANGTLDNFKVKANEPIWLRLSVVGNRITGFVSLNGVDFTKLAEKSDNEIKFGGIGIHSQNASFLLESIEFRQ
jgi:hypothetical protein